jgi:O-antigen ligase
MNLWMPALLAWLSVGILTVWIPGVWSVGAFEVGVFLLAASRLVLFGRLGEAKTKQAWVPLLSLLVVPVLGVAQLLCGLSSYPYVTKLSVLAWTSTFCVFWMVSTLDPEEATWFRRGMLWFSFVVAAVAVLQIFTSAGAVFWIFPTEYKDSVLGPFVSRNQWGAFVEIGLPMALYQALRSRRHGFLYGAMAATLFASVVAGASRAGTALCTLAIVAVPLLARRKGVLHQGGGWLLARILAMAAAFVLVVGPGAVWDRFFQPDPYALRREFLLSSLAMIKQHPLTGFGLGTWATVYPQFALVDPGLWANRAHNDWIQWAVEGGGVLLTAWAVIAAWAARRAIRTVWGFGVLLVLAHCWVDYPFSLPALAAWITAVLGLLAASPKAEPSLGTSEIRVPPVQS